MADGTVGKMPKAIIPYGRQNHFPTFVSIASFHNTRCNKGRHRTRAPLTTTFHSRTTTPHRHVRTSRPTSSMMTAQTVVTAMPGLGWAEGGHTMWVEATDVWLTMGIGVFVVLWLALWQQLVARDVVSSTTTRKAIHISCGPAFVALWPFYSTAPGARVCAAIIPALFGVALVTSALARKTDSGRAALGRSISRHGNPREALQGPLYYTGVFVVLSLILFRNVTAAVATMQLCLGDGLAEVVGRRYGGSSKWPFPWVADKSVAGSSAFAITAFAGSCGAVFWFHYFQLCDLSLADSSTVASLAFISLACSAVELAPTSIVGDDNVAIAVLAVILCSLTLGPNILS